MEDDLLRFEKVLNDSQIEIVASLARKIWHEYFPSIIGDAQVEYMLEKFQSSDSIATQIERESYFYEIIVLNGEPIGYLGLVPKAGALFISKLYIQKKMRKKGCGSKALEHIEEMAAGRRFVKMSLTVNKNNLFAIAFYEKTGFSKVDSVVVDIGGGFLMDDYVMEKGV